LDPGRPDDGAGADAIRAQRHPVFVDLGDPRARPHLDARSSWVRAAEILRRGDPPTRMMRPVDVRKSCRGDAISAAPASLGGSGAMTTKIAALSPSISQLS
jgi:hypothetical protein